MRASAPQPPPRGDRAAPRGGPRGRARARLLLGRGSPAQLVLAAPSAVHRQLLRRLRQAPGAPGRAAALPALHEGAAPGGKAWLILYTTRRANGSIGLASGLVLTPPAAGSSPLPVIAYAHGTSGIAQACAPSLLGGEGPFYSGIPAVQQVVKQGWAIVATDYAGMGTAGPSLLSDRIRRGPLGARSGARRAPAARRLALEPHGRVGLLAGRAGGAVDGRARPSYAPDVELSGVAAMAPATEPGEFLDRAEHNPTVAALDAYTLAAYAAAYPDVHMDRYVRAGALDTVGTVASKCLGGPQPAPAYVESLPDAPWPFTAPLTSGALGRRLAQNVPTRRVASRCWSPRASPTNSCCPKCSGAGWRSAGGRPGHGIPDLPGALALHARQRKLAAGRRPLLVDGAALRRAARRRGCTTRRLRRGTTPVLPRSRAAARPAVGAADSRMLE